MGLSVKISLTLTAIVILLIEYIFQFEVDMGKFMKRRPARAENRVVTEVKKEIKDEPEDVVEVLGEDETWETIDLDQASSATSFNSYGNQRAKGKDNLRKLCSKSQSIRKKCTPDWGAGICAVLKKGMMPINAQINKMLPEALEYLNNNIPKALGILVPFAINKIVPAKFAGVAVQMANESVVPYVKEAVVPYLVDTVIPSAVDTILSEETRIEIAIQNSLKDSS